MDKNNIDLIIKKLNNEIETTKKGHDKEISLVRLKEIARVYRGEDRVIPFSEVEQRIKVSQDDIKIFTGWEKLDALLKGFRLQQSVVVSALTKSGKCLSKDTPILMYDGTLKMIQDIKVGECVMGVDSKPRKVLALGEGKEEMFEISQRGAKYIVNKSHILSLKKTGDINYSKYNGKITSQRYSKGEIVNISVNDYLKSSNGFKHRHKGYKIGIDFKEQPIEIDPYFIGTWLGDGSSNTSAITTADIEIKEYIKQFAFIERLNLLVQHQPKNASEVMYLSNSWANHLLDRMKEYKLINYKHIPTEYKINSREIRLQVLAGLIDTDGYITKNKYPYIDYITKSKQLADDIYFLASSLGFQVVVKQCKKSIKSKGFIGDYFRISISGDLSQIPTKIKRKQSKFKPQKDVLTSKIEIKPLGIGKYYGFELDGDGLFVLGNFIATHNTSFLMDITTRLNQYNPLWFSFEQSIDELISISLERGQKPPKGYTPESLMGNTVEWVESKIVEAIAKYDTKVVFIDHLDFIVPLSGDNHHLMIAKTMREIKGLAKKWNILIFIVCHLQKAKMDTQPTLEDLRGSSSIGQEADTVILLWREMKREDGQVIITNNVNVSVQASRRYGSTGNVKMVYDNGKFIEKEWETEASKALAEF